MRIIASQEMFGYPVLKIRRLMRAAAGGRWGVSFVIATMGIGTREASKLVRAMLSAGLIAKSDLESDGQTYELTIKGMELGMASAAKPIKRATADRCVSEFLQRVEQVNNDPDLLFWIDEVVVIGSYLTNSPTLSDIDLAVTYTRRVGPDLWLELAKQRVERARACGREFRSIFERIAWPLKEIELRLRNRAWALHIHNLSEERKFIESVPHVLLFHRPGSMPTRHSENRMIVQAAINRWCKRVLELTEGRPSLSEQSLVER